MLIRRPAAWVRRILKIKTMSKNEANPEKTSKKEQAINLEATHGKEINHQVKDKQEHHQPRDSVKNDQRKS